MAKRATVRRRRRFLALTAVVVVSLTTLFIRDVLQAAHDSKSNQVSLNRSFVVLANASLREQDTIDAATVDALTHARNLSRAELATSLNDLSQRMNRVAENARIVLSPTVGDNTNVRFVELTLQRVTAWRTVRDAIEAPLHLHHRRAPSTTELRAALAAIQASNSQWTQLRYALAKKPGRCVMRASAWSLGAVAEREITALARFDNLRPLAAVAIGAIAIDPQPLPSRSAQIVLLPKTEVGIGISVRNVGRSTVTVDVTVSTRWRRGEPASMSARRTIPAGHSSAVIFSSVPTYPGVRGTLTIHVGGAPPAWRGAATREYSVKVAPSD